MPSTGPGERAVQLPRFWPDLASLRMIAQNPESADWPLLRDDPGLLLFFLNRHQSLAADSPTWLTRDDCHALAAMLGDRETPWINWRDLRLRPVMRAAWAAARFAEILGENTKIIDPARAWAGAWLAYAGWLAVGVASPDSLTDCLSHAQFGDDPFGSQVRSWGKTRAEIAWRLAGSWTLPQWARLILGRLDLPPEQAKQLGGDRKLQAVVQIAVVLAEQHGPRLFVADEFDLALAMGELRIKSHDLDKVRERFVEFQDFDAWINRAWTDPRSDAELIDRLTGEFSSENEAVSEPVDLFAKRVQTAKLLAMAEFAAGASHEINNPLAVISGQSQYLLKQESDETRRRALQSIVRQTRRIHSILAELMYFAKPPSPQYEWVELGRLMREAAVPIAPLAAERDVDVQIAAMLSPLWIDVDPKQMTMALSALIRNGVEAAPAGGWVKVSSIHRPDRLDIIVEDNGPGLDERSKDHLFDPFFSGRAAGRGRGLGLSAAWRLVREHGGDVQYLPHSDGTTRFAVSLAPGVIVTGAARKSA